MHVCKLVCMHVNKQYFCMHAGPILFNNRPKAYTFTYLLTYLPTYIHIYICIYVYIYIFIYLLKA